MFLNKPERPANSAADARGEPPDRLQTITLKIQHAQIYNKEVKAVTINQAGIEMRRCQLRRVQRHMTVEDSTIDPLL